MFEFALDATPRESRGKNSNRRIRGDGQIPAVVYGKKISPIAVTVDPRRIMAILHSESGRNTIFKLNLNKEQLDVLIQDFQMDPIRGDLLHADFQAIAMDEKRVFEVPVEPVGEPVGVSQQGGMLDMVLREIEVECLPGNVPDHIPVEVGHLEIGDSLRVGDLKIESQDFEILADEDLVLLTVVMPKLVEEEPAEEEAEEGAEVGAEEEEAQAEEETSEGDEE